MQSPFKKQAKWLIEKGFSVIPIKGKAPIGRWGEFQHRQMSPDELKQAETIKDAGIGLVCGKISGVVALDFDSYPEVHKKIQASLPEPVSRKRGHLGETIFYRYTGEISRKFLIEDKTCVEILSDGRQTVIPPSIHPKTGKPYRWIGLPVEELERGQLPVLPPNLVEIIETAIAEHKSVLGLKEKPSRKIHAKISIKELEKALTYLNPEGYEDWIKIGMCIKSAMPTPQGFAIFDTWSRKSPKYRGEEETKLKWDSFKKEGSTIATLYFLAREQGYEIPNKKAKKRKATVDEYIAEFPKVLGPIRREIFSGDAVYYDEETKLWEPAANAIDVIQTHLQRITEQGEVEYSKPWVPTHLSTYEKGLPRCFPINIPTWDGEDRISELAARLQLSSRTIDRYGLTPQMVEELIMAFHSKMWLRLRNPAVQNEIIILSGAQGIGKDFWLKENLGALGQYLIDFAVHSNERDTKAQLHHGLVMNISEFDRTAKTEISLLKEIVTAESTHLRFAYDRRATARASYCSFVASCNTADVLADYTGNRRFILIEVEDIDKSRSYTPEDRLQVLAQGQYLAKTNYFATPTTRETMAALVANRTPDNPNDALVEAWDIAAKQFVDDQSSLMTDIITEGAKYTKHGEYAGFLPNSIILELITKLSRDMNVKRNKFCNVLKANDRKAIIPALGKGYYYKAYTPSKGDLDPPYTLSNKWKKIDFFNDDE